MTILSEQLREVATNLHGMNSIEIYKRCVLFPKVLCSLLPSPETESFIKELLQDSYRTNKDLLQFIVEIYEGEYNYNFILEHQDIFDNAVNYLITGDHELESKVDQYFVTKAHDISLKIATDYLSELSLLDS